MKNSFFILFILFLAIRMQAQEAEIKDYMDRSGKSILLYSGKEDIKYPNMRVHPYLDTDEFREGVLLYDGILYPGVRLRLNTHTDELSVLLPANAPSDRIEYAQSQEYTVVYGQQLTGNALNIGSAFFSNIVSTDLIEYAQFPEYTLIYNRQSPNNEVKTGSALPPGYYARMMTEKYPVYRREIRYPKRNVDGMQVEWIFNIQTRLYIYKDGKYHSVGSKGSVLKLFKDKKNELNRYAKQTGLNFGNDRVNAVVALVRYYESITANP